MIVGKGCDCLLSKTIDAEVRVRFDLSELYSLRYYFVVDNDSWLGMRLFV